MLERTTLTNRYLAALNTELGWNAAVDGSGDVGFDSGTGFRVWLSNYAPQDPEYIQLNTGFKLSRLLDDAGASFDPSQPEQRLHLCEAALRLAGKLKGVKVIVAPDDDAVVFSVETVGAGPRRMPSVDFLASILPRMQAMLRAGVTGFHEDLVLIGLEASASSGPMSGPTELAE